MYALAGKKEKAMECLVKVLTEIKDDPMLLIEVAQLSEENDDKRALRGTYPNVGKVNVILSLFTHFFSLYSL